MARLLSTKSVLILIVSFNLAVINFFTSPASALNCESAFLGQGNYQSDETDQAKATNGVPTFSLDRVQTEIDSLFATIESAYGPLVDKYDTKGVNLSDLKVEFKKKAALAKNTNQIYFLYSELFNRLKDAHVSVRLPSNFSRTLPLQFDYRNGKTVLTYVHGKKYPSDQKIPSPGDILVSMDGMQPDQWRERFSKYRSTGEDTTDKRTLSFMLTSRTQARGYPVSLERDQTARLTLISRETGQYYTIEIPWDTNGVPLVGVTTDGTHDPDLIEDLFKRDKEDDDQGNPIRVLSRSEAKKSLSNHITQIASLQDRLMSLNAFQFETPSQASKEDVEDRGKKISIGSEDPFFGLPKGFKKIKAPFFMGMMIDSTKMKVGSFKRDGKTYGFMRIPSYVPSNIPFAYYAVQYIMKWMENNVDELIIDQSMNGGGLVVYSDWIIKGLVPEASADRHMKFKARPTQGFLRQYSTLIDTVQDAAENEELKGQAKEDAIRIRDKYLPLMKEEFMKVYNALQNGDFESEPISLFYVSEYMAEMLRAMPNQVTQGNSTFRGIFDRVTNFVLGHNFGNEYHFTKKTWMIIDALDFSGGDATPANLKYYNRVTLIGDDNTAGAGGAVIQMKNSVQLPFDFSLTNSLMVMPDGTLIENRGVAPDIFIEITEDDVATNYEDTFENRYMRVISKPN